MYDQGEGCVLMQQAVEGLARVIFLEWLARTLCVLR
jgi:hypothetical protein